MINYHGYSLEDLKAKLVEITQWKNVNTKNIEK